MAHNDRRATSPLKQFLIFFVTFFVVALGLQLIFGNELTGRLIVIQVVTAAITAVIFTMATRWYQRRS